MIITQRSEGKTKKRTSLLDREYAILCYLRLTEQHQAFRSGGACR
jgi:hypothetical protein